MSTASIDLYTDTTFIVSDSKETNIVKLNFCTNTPIYESYNFEFTSTDLFIHIWPQHVSKRMHALVSAKVYLEVQSSKL